MTWVERILATPCPLPSCGALASEVCDVERGMRPQRPSSPSYFHAYRIAAAEGAAKPVSCSNDPCPVCGGHGPSGEWFEGCEVRCDDCGAMLYVTDIETCNGRSRFEKVPAPCQNEDHDEDCELECAALKGAKT